MHDVSIGDNLRSSVESASCMNKSEKDIGLPGERM
jgi:hypothetical protein